MAESVDALVSNTSGATRAGSTPALGTAVKSNPLQEFLAGDFCLLHRQVNFLATFVGVRDFLF